MNPVRQSLPLDILHGNEGDPVGFSNFINVGDIRVIEGGGRLGLLDKAPHSVWIGSDFNRQGFQRSNAVEPGVACSVHLPHPTGAQQGKNFVGADLPSHHGSCFVLSRHSGYHLPGGLSNEALSLLRGRHSPFKATSCCEWFRLYHLPTSSSMRGVKIQ